MYKIFLKRILFKSMQHSEEFDRFDNEIALKGSIIFYDLC